MPQEEQQLRLEVVLDDQATEQLAKLRGEMQKLTGGEMQSGIEKLHKQADALQRRLIPLYGSFAEVTDKVRLLVRGLGPMGLAIAGVGTAATLAAGNVLRFIEKMAELGQLSRTSGLPSGVVKEFLDTMARANVPPEIRQSFVEGFSKSVDEVTRESSPLVQFLNKFGAEAGGAGQKAMEQHKTLMRKWAKEHDYVKMWNEVFRAVQGILDPATNPLLNPEQRAQRAKEFAAAYGMDENALRKGLDAAKQVTKEMNDEIAGATAQAEAFKNQVAEVELDVIALLDEIAKLTGGIETLTKFAEKVAEILEGALGYLEEFEKGIFSTSDKTWGLGGLLQGEGPEWAPEKDETWRGRLWRGGPLMGPTGMEPQKQSFMGDSGGFASLVMKAKFEENTDRLEDDTRARHELLNELIILNDFFRGRFGGGGGAGPGSTTITTPEGTQVVTSPNDQIRVADARIQTKDADILATQSTPAGFRGGRLAAEEAGSQSRGGIAGSVDEALKYLGLNESRERDQKILKEYMQTGGKNLTGDQNAWCARFVNAVNVRAGLPGNESWAAKSFLDWGRAVGRDEQIVADDVFVKSRKGDGHTGVATGNYRVNPKTGETEYEMLSGNIGGSKKGGGEVGLTYELISGRGASGVAGGGRGGIIGIRRGEPVEPVPPSGGPPAARHWTAPTMRERERPTTSLAGLDRAMGNEMNHTVEGTGKIDVEVAAPKKASNGNGADLFRRTEIIRQRQMEPAGPERISQVP